MIAWSMFFVRSGRATHSSQITTNSQRNEALPHATADGIRPVLRPELRENRRHVKLHGVLADGQPRRNRAIRQSFSEHLQHFELAPCQVFFKRNARQSSPSLRSPYLHERG